MRIAIVGAGAMGSLLGGWLAESGEDVRLVDPWKEHVDRINAHGLRILGKEGGERRVRIPATTDPCRVRGADLVVLFVKSYDTPKASEEASPMGREGALFLTLQNGLGNAEILVERVGRSRVLAGTTAHGSTLIGPGCILHAGEGETLLGPWSPEAAGGAREVVSLLNRAGVSTRYAEDIHRVLWEKLLVNVGINALTALTGLYNGQILEIPEAAEIMESAVKEATEVAMARGVRIQEDMVERTREVARRTAKNRSSMGQDVDRQRRTEIDAINGAIIREATACGLPVPVNRVLTALLKAIEGR